MSYTWCVQMEPLTCHRGMTPAVLTKPSKGVPFTGTLLTPSRSNTHETAWWHLWVSVPGTQRRRNVFESLHLQALFRVPTDAPCCHLHLETVFLVCAVPSGLLLGSFIYIQDAWSHVYRSFGGVCLFVFKVGVLKQKKCRENSKENLKTSWGAHLESHTWEWKQEGTRLKQNQARQMLNPNNHNPHFIPSRSH